MTPVSAYLWGFATPVALAVLYAAYRLGIVLLGIVLTWGSHEGS